MTLRAIILSFGIVSATGVRAECAATFLTAQDIFRCAVTNHPYVARERARLKQGDQRLEIASTLPNPEIEARFDHEDTDGRSSLASDVVIRQPIELGGRRSARQLKARAERMSGAAEAVAVQERVTIQAVLDLYRLRQLFDERERVAEALRTFDRVARQYQRRGHLAPEQEVELAVFRMAASDYRIRESLVVSEIQSRVRSLEFATGRELDVTPKLVPAPRATWPDLNTKADVTSFSEVLKAKSDLTEAGAEVDLASADAWPSLALGPTFTRSGSADSSFGVAVNLTLPLFDRATGRRNFARLGVEMAGRNFDAVRTRVVNERANLIDQYRRAVESLTSVGNIDPLREHAKIEGFMERGIISSALVIESHRQLIEFLRSRHEQEIAALEALWHVYAIDGTIEAQPL